MAACCHIAPALAYDLPDFRIVEPAQPPNGSEAGPVRLLADADFPPYSFASSSGGPSGLAVELALAACGEAGLTCDVVLVPFEGLLPALEKGDGEVVISGLRIEPKSLESALVTRPWFRTLGRFAVLSGNPLTNGDAKSFAGRRIGVVKDTSHARWLAAYYKESEMVPFDDEEQAHAALQTGNVDAYFGDNLRVIYWTAGQASGNCCKLLGGAFSDFDYFSRNMSFLVRKDRDDLREALDYGLDAAQGKRLTEKIFNAYVPLSPW